jgi:hypothetical protein
MPTNPVPQSLRENLSHYMSLYAEAREENNVKSMSYWIDRVMQLFAQARYDESKSFAQEQQALLERVKVEVIGQYELGGDARIDHYSIPKGVKRFDVPRVDFMTRNKLREEQHQALAALEEEIRSAM